MECRSRDVEKSGMIRPRLSRAHFAWVAVTIAVLVTHARASNERWTDLAFGPENRAASSAAFDPIAKRLVVFGGIGSSNDTWSLTMPGLDGWTRHILSNPPSARYGSSMVYDPVRHRMLLFGGYDNNHRNDVWEL